MSDKPIDREKLIAYTKLARECIETIPQISEEYRAARLYELSFLEDAICSGALDKEESEDD